RRHAEPPADGAVEPDEADRRGAARPGRRREVRMCGVQLRVAARPNAHRDPQQLREVADHTRARAARRVVHDQHLPHDHAPEVAIARAPTHTHASTRRTTGSAAAHTCVHPPSSLQAFDSTGIMNRPTANPAATSGATGSGTTSTTAASTRCGRAEGE